MELTGTLLVDTGCVLAAVNRADMWHDRCAVVDGSMSVTSPEPGDWTRIAELVARYRSIGTVDASVVATAERIGLTTIATVDRRHFTMVRPRHVAAFTLVP